MRNWNDKKQVISNKEQMRELIEDLKNCPSAEKLESIYKKIVELGGKARQGTKVQKVARSYNKELPAIIESLEKCKTSRDLHKAYKKLVKTWCEPWRTRKRIPARYKSFWSIELDKLALRRKKLYRRARRTQRPEDWGLYHECKHQVRTKVNKRKYEQYQEYISELEEKDGQTALKQLARMKKKIKRRTARNKMTGRPMNSTRFSAHISKTCHSP